MPSGGVMVVIGVKGYIGCLGRDDLFIRISEVWGLRI